MARHGGRMEMVRKRMKLFAACLAIAVVAGACGGDDGGGAAPGGGGQLPATIKIGVPLDTSGSAAIAGVGNAELAGVRLAANEINNTGFLGNTKIELVV